MRHSLGLVRSFNSRSTGMWFRTAKSSPAAPPAVQARSISTRSARSWPLERRRRPQLAAVKVPGHRAGPPVTITDVDYENLLRVPDRRFQTGKRNYALLRVLGDCGIRSAELRGLLARDVRKPRSNARHHRLYIRGKGGVEREVPIPEATFAALGAWLAVHPLARGRAGLRDEHHLFVRLGPRPGAIEPGPLSAQAVYKIVRGAAISVGVPTRLVHPHALRSYWRFGRSGTWWTRPVASRTVTNPSFGSADAGRGSSSAVISFRRASSRTRSTRRGPPARPLSRPSGASADTRHPSRADPRRPPGAPIPPASQPTRSRCRRRRSHAPSDG